MYLVPDEALCMAGTTNVKNKGDYYHKEGHRGVDMWGHCQGYAV